MNNTQFVPDWAEKTLTKPAPFDQAELAILRDFYQAWETLHANARDKLHKSKAEEAAQKMVGCARTLRAMKHPNNPRLTLNGVKLND